MGWTTSLLLLLALIWWFKQCFPFSSQSADMVRSAATTGVLLFALHGLVDVSGHRVGSAFVALFLVGLAMPMRRMTVLRRWMPWVSRGFGMMLALIATWWFASLYGMNNPPTTVTLERLQHQIKTMAASNNLSTVPELATAALEIAPLDWTLYFQRGSAKVWRRGSPESALNDFRTARFLEGIVWLAAEETEFCMEAWKDGLTRAGSNAPAYFGQMLANSNADGRNALRELAATNVDYLLVFLRAASRGEVKTEIANFLITDPNLETLSADQRKEFLSIWWERGDKNSLIAQLATHEAWQAAGWPYLAEHFADEEDYERACEIMVRFAQAPAVPDLATQQPLSELQREFYSRPDDFARGLALCLSQIKQQHTDDALLTLRALKKIKNHPHYIAYLEAQLLSDKRQWKEAWSAWTEFATTRL